MSKRLFNQTTVIGRKSCSIYQILNKACRIITG